ncbi:hypothetical protein ABZ858_00235 [Streptomyces sp. NPDC047017]|uniref:hypothetical protein n=1 Tax=Streptomyces sp. NPDC047017 TaxID=3155024 RepID=UPI0033E6F73B
MTTTQLPRRASKVAEPRPAPAAAFNGTQLSAPREPAADMTSLAERVRHLMNLTNGRQLTLPLGGGYFDVVVTASGAEAHGIVTVLDEVQRTSGDSPDACGPVIEDPERGWLIWLVPPGTADCWEPHRFASCLGAPHQLTLPSMHQSDPPGAFWLRRMRSDRLIPPGPLRNLLAQFQPGPVPHETLLSSALNAI